MTSRTLAGICSLIGFAAAVGYLVIIQHQDGEIAGSSWIWAAVMALPAAVALIGVFATRARPRRMALVFAAIVYGIVGLLALFSIGIVFVAAGLAALLGAALLRSDPATERV